MRDPLRTLWGNKKICTGVELYEGTAPDLHPQVSTEVAFGALVSEYYKFFRERLAVDVAFLRTVQRRKPIGAFDHAVNMLRTAKQHHDNPKAEDFYKAWIVKHQSWPEASNALALMFREALIELALISGYVRGNSTLTATWKERATLQPESIFDAVCIDLQTQYPGNIRRALIANVERRAKQLRRNADVRESVRDFCAQAITAETRSLPVPYDQVLDRLGLIGDQQARAALLLAYAVSASTSLEGENFLVRVEKTWVQVNS